MVVNLLVPPLLATNSKQDVQYASCTWTFAVLLISIGETLKEQLWAFGTLQNKGRWFKLAKELEENSSFSKINVSQNEEPVFLQENIGNCKMVLLHKKRFQLKLQF